MSSVVEPGTAPLGAEAARSGTAAAGEVESSDVLILGASFTGLELLYQLRRRPAGRGLRVTLIDRHRRHGYLPLVHERLCGRLEPGESEIHTAADVDADADASFVQGEIVAIDPVAKEVELAGGRRLRGRFLVVALGSVLEPPPAIDGREHLLRYKLADEQVVAAQRLAELLGGAAAEGALAPTIVVVGGGISGVELAGELAHLAKVRPSGWIAPKVILVHGGARLMPGFAARVAKRTRRYLESQGVELRLSARLIAAEADRVRLREGEGEGEAWLSSNMTLWSGGIRPAPLIAGLALPRTDAGWLAVGPTLQCYPTPTPSQPDVFAGGDAVRVIGGEGEWPTMQRAIECLWQASVIAQNILTLAAEPQDYPSGVPPLMPHRLRPDFFHGVSLGGRSLVVYGRAMVDVAGVNTWFRRFLMRSYFARYRHD